MPCASPAAPRQACRHDERVGLVGRRHHALVRRSTASRCRLAWPWWPLDAGGSARARSWCASTTSASPAAMRGSHAACSVVGRAGQQRWARPARRRRTAALTRPRPSSSITTIASTAPKPMPPCASVHRQPGQAELGEFAVDLARGAAFLGDAVAALEARSLCRPSAPPRRAARVWSSVNSKSMVQLVLRSRLSRAPSAPRCCVALRSSRRRSWSCAS